MFYFWLDNAGKGKDDWRGFSKIGVERTSVYW